MKRCLLSGLMVMLAFAPQSARAADVALPPGEKEAKAALEKSPRHGEWVDVDVPGRKTPVRTYVVYPERKEKAPVVIVIHEIFGLTDWARGVADQVAAEGFIALAPDLLSGHGKGGAGTDSFAGRDDVVKAVRDLKDKDVVDDLDAVRGYGLKIPAANGKVATIGFCWGGGQSFAYAASQPALNAAVVYYGTPPGNEDLAKVNAPVLGLYGGNDARVTSTVIPTATAMKKLGKSYAPHVFDGAGHGFLRAQDGQDGANLKAAHEAWPQTLHFLRRQTEPHD